MRGVPPLAPLPIDDALPELLSAVSRSGAAVLHAPPGAGKTTRVPPALADALGAAGGRVVVLEPRRVAARAAARRIADERGWRLGREVGWWIRFERRFGADTRVVFATEGVLLRWLQRDPFLDGVGAVVFDEFHERALASDLALALARRVRLEARPELRLVVMSATLDAEPIARFLGGTPIVRSEGRLHPVETRLLERTGEERLEARVADAVRRAAGARDGDLLVFLPGLGEIRRVEEALAAWAAERGVDLRPLHGDLPIEQQDAALRPGPRRRVVLATNVAESSVTVEGVRTVIDSGLARQLRFDPATGLDRLDLVRIARAAADQRAGRAGREAPGLCLRLWTAADDLALRPFETPEVQRVDLAGAVLELAAWGEPDAGRFDWFEAPDAERLRRAQRELRDLGALDASGITPLGRRLAELPLPPRLGRLVLAGERLGVAADAALAAALLADRDPFRGQDAQARAGSRSDLADRLAALEPRRHARLFEARDQILRLLQTSSPQQATADRLAQTGAGAEAETETEAATETETVFVEKLKTEAFIEGNDWGTANAAPEGLGAEVNGGGGSGNEGEGKRRGKNEDKGEGEAARVRATAAGAAKPPDARAPTPFNGKPLPRPTSKATPPPPPSAPGASPRDSLLLRAIAAAYLDRLCRRREAGSERAVMVGGRGVRLGRASAVRDAPLFVAVALDSGRAGERAEDFVRLASVVERDWLPPESVTTGDELDWDATGERVVALRRTRFDDLVLDEREIPIADDEAASALLAARAAVDLARALPLDERDVAGLLGRLRFLATVRPDLELPAAGDDLLRIVLPALAAGRRSFAELRRAPLGGAILDALGWRRRQALDELAPERLALPSGSQLRVDYSDPARPVLAARIQELFGLRATPRLAGGRVPVLLHLLAPNGRPQQVTDDLDSFWRNTYPIVRRELAGRYPKHAWPEDPLTAKPGRRR
jgi:ATP-dependent helicase HrpB